jgi:HSP20 family protein
MFARKETHLTPTRFTRDPFALLRQMTSELDDRFWPSFRWTPEGFTALPETTWSPKVDVFEKDNCLITKIDLPGMKKENVKVQFVEGRLVVFGERKNEADRKEDNYYRCEREYGSFYRAVPLPETVKFEDVKATFADGVLEITVPLPAKVEPAPRHIEIEEAAKTTKAA